MKNLFLSLIILICSQSFAQRGWFYINPTPTGSGLKDIKMFDENTGICLGNREILRTTNGGENWNVIPSTTASSNFGMSMVDNANGYIAIDSGAITKTTNGGLDWHYSSRVNSSYIQQIYFANVNTGYVLGSTYSNLQSLQKVFRTTNGGNSWDEQITTYELEFENIFFYSSTGYIIGGNYDRVNNIYKSKILKTTNNGFTWDSIPNNIYENLSSIYFTSENTGYVSGTGAHVLYKTVNGGVNWNQIAGFGSPIKDINFTDLNSGYILTNNFFVKTTNGGLNWVSRSLPSSAASLLTKISIVNQNKYFSVGYYGALFVTTNGGINWTNYTKNLLDVNFWDAKFYDKNTGFITGDDNGTAYRTTNGGENWVSFLLNSTTSGSLSSIAMANKNTWYISEFYDGKIFKTTNMGLSWVTHSLNIYGILDIKFLNENTGFGVCKYNYFFKTTNGGINWYKNDFDHGQHWAIDFIDENTGMIGGSNRAFKTTNGGLNWDSVSGAITSSTNDIKYLNKDTIFILTYHGINKTTNGGVNWSFTQFQTIYNPLLQFTNERIGYISGSGKMFKTTNTGESWNEIRFCSSSTNGLSFVDSVSGYAVGYEGVIVKTTDGGASTFIKNTNESIAKSFSLYQNYPNPFNPSTRIKFTLPKNESVKIIIFDILGRKIETLLDENLTAGVHELNWNASGYAAGVYFYMLQTDSFIETKKMMLIK